MCANEERIEETAGEADADIFDELMSEEKGGKTRKMPEPEEIEIAPRPMKKARAKRQAKEGKPEHEKEPEEIPEDSENNEDAEDPEDLDSEEGIEEAPGEKPSRENIRKTIIENAELSSISESAGASAVPLKFLEDKDGKAVFIGRKKAFLQKYGFEGALHIGRIAGNETEHQNKDIYFDSLNPHVVFVCGARGSGKSYDLGVIAEELALKNPNIGTIVIDPIGVFWSMRHPNKEEKEIAELTKWNMLPQGLHNLKVFIPEGMAEKVPKTTYDATFAMPPIILTADDWCLTFGIERFSPTGLLLDLVLKRVEHGYRNLQGKSIKAKEKGFSLEDLIECLHSDSELNSRERGYKQDSIRALASRFEAAKTWGIFDEKGTPLAELSREGQLTIIDTSFLEDNVSALVIGILSRRILAARKLSTRKEAAKKFKTMDVDELLEVEIPPTWLFIDEAHTLIPSGNVKTPATTALVEYVKQGRRPGCSLVFATQQPSAIDAKVLSQLDLLITHKLVFDDDIKAVYRRAPTIIPMQYKRSNFIKTMPIGTGLVADRSEETSRAFVLRIRPRMSQHEGREAETSEYARTFSQKQVDVLAVEMVMRKLEKEHKLDIEIIRQVVETLDAKYKAKTKLQSVLEAIEKKGANATKDFAMLGEIPNEPEIIELAPSASAESAGIAEEEQGIELLTLPMRISEDKAHEILNKNRKRKVLGIFGKEEAIKSLRLEHITIWKVDFEEYKDKVEFVKRSCYINSLTGEFLHFMNGDFAESNGLSRLYELHEEEINLLLHIGEKTKDLQEIAKILNTSDAKARTLAEKMADKGLLEKEKIAGKNVYGRAIEIDLPLAPEHELLESLGKMPFVSASVMAKCREQFPKEKIPELLRKLWPNVKVKSIAEIYRPVWRAVLESEGTEKTIRIDAITGKILKQIC